MIEKHCKQLLFSGQFQLTVYIRCLAIKIYQNQKTFKVEIEIDFMSKIVKIKQQPPKTKLKWEIKLNFNKTKTNT